MAIQVRNIKQQSPTPADVRLVILTRVDGSMLRLHQSHFSNPSTKLGQAQPYGLFFDWGSCVLSDVAFFIAEAVLLVASEMFSPTRFPKR